MNINLETSDGRTFSIPAENRNEEAVRRIIQKTENPNPILIFIIVLGVILLMYYIYVVYVTIDLNGDWVSPEKEIKVEHNKWTNSICVHIDEGEFHARLDGRAIIGTRESRGKFGVYKRGQIHWTGNDEVWKRPAYA